MSLDMCIELMKLKKGKRTRVASELWDARPLWRLVCNVRVWRRRWKDFLIIVVDRELKRVFGQWRESRRILMVE